MRAPRTSLAVAAAALVATAVPALAQDGADVQVVDSAFQPAEVTVEEGGTVTWTQTGALPHSVTADDGSFDSHPGCNGGAGCMQVGDTFQEAFTEPGEYAYYCRVHGAPGGVGMAGTVVVTAAAQPEPTQEPTDGATTPPTEEETPAPADDATEDADQADEDLAATGTPLGLFTGLALAVLVIGAVAVRRSRAG